MRMLLLLILIGAGAYFTVPTRETHEAAAARALMETEAQQQTSQVQQQAGVSLDGIVDFVTGMIAGQGRYESYYVASKFTVDMPGSAYLECWGAFTQVQCRRVESRRSLSNRSEAVIFRTMDQRFITTTTTY